jgi:hypothetical protein
MATYRSLDIPSLGEPLQLSDRLRLNAVVATMRIDYDLVPLLDATPDQAPEPERTPTYLMWDLSDDQHIRLSRVDPVLFDVIGKLQAGPQPVAALVVDHVQEGREPLNYERFMHVLTSAQTLGIVRTE